MTGVLPLNDENFTSCIEGAFVPTMVEFTATWCQPCEMMAPTFETIASEYAGQLLVFKIDAEEAVATAAEFRISGYPTCVMFQGGREVDRFEGYIDISAVRERVEKLLPSD